MCTLVCVLLRAIRSVPALVHDMFLGIKHKLTSQEAVGYTVLSTGQPKSAGFSKSMHIRLGRASQIQVPAKCQGLKGCQSSSTAASEDSKVGSICRPSAAPA